MNNEVDDNWSVKQYHKLLEWDIVSQPWITRTAEKLLNPVLGKSLVVQATKSPSAPRSCRRSGGRRCRHLTSPA